VLGPETARLFESGCALTVGTVAPDGSPHASRGWGLTILPGGEQVRLLLDADDGTAIANLASTGAVAVTGAAVPTLRSVQIKGRAEPPVPTHDAADLACAARFREGFFGDVERIEGTPRALLERLTPARLSVCTVTVDELYDQTPGPIAGTALRSSS
jgi:hypothetical protein